MLEKNSCSTSSAQSKLPYEKEGMGGGTGVKGSGSGSGSDSGSAAGENERYQCSSMAAGKGQPRRLTVAFTSEILPGFVFLPESGHRDLEARVSPADQEAGAIGGRPGPADDTGLESSLESVESHFRRCEGGRNVTAQQ